MAFTVTLYSFSKKVNSTARPMSGQPYNFTGCELKGNCSIVSPIIKFNIGFTVNPSSWNYAVITEFNRYYWINDWVWDAGFWYAECCCDVLASYKTEIGSSSNYVLRAQSECNGEILDTLFPLVNQEFYSKNYGDWPWDTSGCYILGVYNDEGICYYAMTPLNFLSFTEWLFGDNIFNGIDATEASEDLLKVVADPMQYIIGAKWFPLSVDSFSGLTGTVKYGFWDTGITGKYVVDSIPAITNYHYTIPKHPQMAEDGYAMCRYFNLEPFTSYQLFLQPFGTISIPTSGLFYSDTLVVNIRVDPISGVATLYCSGDAEQDYCVYLQAQCAVNVSLAATYTDLMSGLSTVAGGLTDLFGLNFLGAANGIANLPSTVAPKLTSTGNNSGNSSVYAIQETWLCGIFKKTVRDIYDEGYALMARRTLSTLPGYQLISSPHVTAKCTASEMEEINSFLSSGYFYE